MPEIDGIAHDISDDIDKLVKNGFVYRRGHEHVWRSVMKIDLKKTKIKYRSAISKWSDVTFFVLREWNPSKAEREAFHNITGFHFCIESPAGEQSLYWFPTSYRYCPYCSDFLISRIKDEMFT